MSIRFRDTGFDRAQARLEREGLEVMRESAESMKDEAQRLAPVDTTELRESITRQNTLDGAIVYTDVDWGVWQEFGTGIYAEGGDGRKTPWSYQRDGRWIFTRGNRPQPFMRPSLGAAFTQFKVSKRSRGL